MRQLDGHHVTSLGAASLAEAAVVSGRSAGVYFPLDGLQRGFLTLNFDTLSSPPKVMIPPDTRVSAVVFHLDVR